jgi:aryl-alcohol dehydrogenase-like predicted oxidoreductase
METRQLGNSDLQITRLGIGAWAIGGSGWNGSMGPHNESDSIPAIHAALDRGLNWIDTAALYGLGHSEEVIAKALRDRSPRPYIFTKCERVWDANGTIGACLKAASIRKECEDSLRRLQVDVLDLYQIHWPEPDEDVEEGWQTMLKLKEEGKARWVGLSNFSAEQMTRAGKFGPITSLQPPYSLIRPEVEASILPHCQKHNIGVIAYSPMGSGLLTGTMTRERIAAMPADDWRKEKNRFYQEPLLTRNLLLADKLKTIGARHGKSAGEVAIAWVLRHSAVTGAIVGARKTGQLKELIGAADWRLTQPEVDEIHGFLKSHSG